VVLALGPHFHSNSPGCRVIQSNFIPGELIQSSIYSGKTFQYGILPGKLIQSNSYSEENLSNPAFIPEKQLFNTTYFPGKTYPAQCLFWGKLIQSSIFSGENFSIQHYSVGAYPIQHLSGEKIINTTFIPGKTYPIHQ
jgi:hypothetical protein